ncbi:uncharacterized protein LOC126748300 isoform X2 [Anthonomus grandis grandis]|uniref:uncharacterized protein LOC126748300 isoform X2 n=1 Tax=Anthonomus grandis grandis TaxID=2921223 RepID=UPI002166BD76|nr:uncharacterized protein LOC126748300 isoform X2 [Anthonomus grandis grandis]
MADCILCQSAKVPHTSVFLSVNWDKLETIMEPTFTDIKVIEQESICQKCDQLICTYHEFKTSILSNEKTLKTHVENSKSNVLEELLVLAGQLDKYNKEKPVTCCRTCYQVTPQKNRIKLDSYQNFLGTMVLTCLPGLNIFLTEECFICSLCHNTLVAFYQFVNMCQDIVKNKKASKKPVEEYESSPKKPKLDADVGKSDGTSSESEEPLLLATKYEEYNNDDPIKVKPKGKRKSIYMTNKTTYRKQLERKAKTMRKSVPTKPVKSKRGRPRKKERNTKIDQLGDKPTVESEPLELPETVEDKQTHTDEPTSSTKRFTRNSLKKTEPKPPSPVQIEKNKNEIHQCQICQFTCPAQESVIWTHLREHKTSLPSGANCWKCGAMFHSMRGIISHFAIHDMGLYLTVEEDPSLKKSDNSNDITEKKSVYCRFKQMKNIINSNLSEFVMAIQCELCQKPFDNYLHFRRHNKLHIKAEMHQCSMCPFSCTSLTEMQRHLYVHHEINALHKVIIKTSIYNDLINDGTQPIREKMKEVETISCQACCNVFTSIRDYVDHECSSKKKYCCGDCSLTFATIDQLDSHGCIPTAWKTQLKPPPDFHIVHTNSDAPTITENPAPKPNFQCAKCTGDFDSENELSSHVCDKPIEPEYHLPVITAIKSEYELENSPTKVDKVGAEENIVSSSTSVDVRMSDKASVAEGEESFVCKCCQYLAKSQDSLTLHIKQCMKSWKCPYDFFATDQSKDLEIHLSLAHNKIGFACPYCNFLSYDQLKIVSHYASIHAPPLNPEDSELSETAKQVLKDQPSDAKQPETSRNTPEKNSMSYTTEPPPLVPFEKEAFSSKEREIIALDSDSEDEFIETPSHNNINTGHINEIVNIDAVEASRLISQGVPVVKAATLMSESPMIWLETDNSDSNESNIHEIPSTSRSSQDGHVNSKITEIAIPDSSTQDSLCIEGFVISDDDDDYDDKTPEKSRQSSSSNTNKTPTKVLVVNTEEHDVLKSFIVSDKAEKEGNSANQKTPISFKLGEAGISLTYVAKKDVNASVASEVSTVESGKEDDTLVILSDEDEDPVTATAKKVKPTTPTASATDSNHIHGYRLFHALALDNWESIQTEGTEQTRNQIIVEMWRQLSEKERRSYVEEARFMRARLIRPQKPRPKKSKLSDNSKKTKGEESRTEVLSDTKLAVPYECVILD